MPEWKDVAPLLTVFFGVIGAIAGYAWNARKRRDGTDQAASRPSIMAAVSEGLADKTRLELIEAQIATALGMLQRLLVHAERADKERERDELVGDILAEFKAAGITFEPKRGTRP